MCANRNASVPRGKGNRLNICFIAIFTISLIMGSRPGFCLDIIKSENQVVLLTKPENIVSAGFWIPTKEETAEALAAIDNYLLKLSKAKKSDMPRPTTQNSAPPTKKQISKIRKSYAKYRVQFMGINFDNRKVIYCNFFMYNLRKYEKWKEEYVDVSVGGSAFWQIDYDVNNKKCSSLTINNEDHKPKANK